VASGEWLVRQNEGVTGGERNGRLQSKKNEIINIFRA
jgi:hypothetical protein